MTLWMWIVLWIYTHGFVFHWGAGMMLVALMRMNNDSFDKIIHASEVTLWKSIFWPFYFVRTLLRG